ncbi:uncharacterized protein LOC143278130 isoform X2 [Babylonia areolata]|uniref:uncharacterized protein LOC143278130 isoform X2 n=1 Tax=Babylonia areolata TaxID=304850 RepID=UPI003FD27878
MEASSWSRGLLCFLVLICCIRSSHCWRGKVCQKTDYIFVTRRVCAYRTWLGCCLYKTIRQPQTKITKFCCSGWKHNGDKNCKIPVCQPDCMNGGTCTKPGKCSCPRQYTGPRCGSSQCSHLDPCFPGECAPGSTRCSCTSGFNNAGQERQARCLKFQKKPEVFEMRANMSYWANMKGSYMEVYSLLSDSSGQQQSDAIWTNRKKFNQLSITATSQFIISDLPPAPEYVSDNNIGIVSAEATIVHTKTKFPSSRRRRRRRSERYVSKNETMPCDATLSYRRPQALLQCKLTQRFDRLLETGDILTITFTSKSGGFRKLKDLNSGQDLKTQNFEGRPSQSSVEFHFDLEAPYHCSELQKCSTGGEPLSVQDLTKDPLEIEWGEWKDGLSGMYRYTLEVFPLNKTLEGRLRILRPLQPIYSLPVLHSELSTPVRYTPPSGGLYALILEAADRANNTRFVRRFALYDPGSDVTVDPTRRLRFSSASPAANFSYQNSTGARIKLTWKDVFRNALHEDLGVLGEVEPFPPQLEDGRKNIPSQSDDHEGRRTVDAIDNRRGIVRFDLAYQKRSRFGRKDSERLSYPPPEVTWRNMNLSESSVLPETVDDGDTVVAWVRATDILGRQLVRRTEVTFDETEAEVGKLKFQMNRPVAGIPFSSTFELTAKDMQSGVAMARWTFTRSNGTIIFEDTVQGKLAPECGAGDFSKCYCTPRGQCYSIDQSYSLSNCHMMVEKESLATEVISVQVDIINAAGLVSTRKMEKGQLTMLNGTEAYFPPQNVRVLSLTQTSATVTWEFPPSCYERTDLWVVEEGKKSPVHKDADRYDLVNLQPGQTYIIQLIARYSGQVQSDPMPFTFRTEEQPALTAGGKAGVVIGVLLLLLVLALVAAVVIIRRRGPPSFLQGERLQNLRNSLRRSRASYSRTGPGGVKDGGNDYTKTAHQPEPQPEDLYLDADQTWQERRPWQVEASCLVLQDQIAVGKFADIYRATWTRRDSGGGGGAGVGGGDGTNFTVAAKILKPGFSTDDANKLMRKIEFFADEVGQHPNVLLFYGAVLDNEHLGPVMMLEYCEMGQLDKWLAGQKGDVSEATMDRLVLFPKDLASGMDHLSSKGIVHSRLAARNILLTFLLNVKIAGFGPKDVADGKVPAKWASPEVLEEKPATEKSDVWAFGVTLWEIFSMGKAPYPEVRGTEIGPYLRSGKRMDKPELADAMFYTLMQKCWQWKPSDRPSFAEIKQQLCDRFPAETRNSGDFYYEARQLRK